jgi:hypothetical protein
MLTDSVVEATRIANMELRQNEGNKKGAPNNEDDNDN